MARKTSEFLKALGKMFEIWMAIVNMVLELGGDDGHLLNLITDRERLRRVAEVIIGVWTEFLFLHFMPEGRFVVSGDEIISCCARLPGRAPTSVEGAYLFDHQDLITHKAPLLIFPDWLHEDRPRTIMSFVRDERSGRYTRRWLDIDEGLLTPVLAVRIKE